MADGMWKMDGDGNFELQEPYRTMLEEARVAATRGWYAALAQYLEPRCPYDEGFLRDELLRRNQKGERAMDTFEAFVLEALSGDL